MAAVGVMLAVAGGALALSQTPASAASNLSVTLSAQGGGSVHWDASGNPVLTVGGAGSSAQMRVNSPSFNAPADAPIFASDHFGGGSPHWLLKFAGGAQLVGLPLGQGDAKPWTVTGTCTSGADTYANQIAFIAHSNCGGAVTSAAIVADSGQASGTSDTITSVQYNDMTLVAGPDVVTVTSPGTQNSTVGVAITPLTISASSNKGDGVSFAATGLPAGLSIDASTGTISGTPTTTGTSSVTVTATDNGGTKGSATFTWNVSTATPPPHVTYSGTIRLYKMGLCLDDANNATNSGAVVQVWRCNGLANQNWQVMSDGTIRHAGLCLDARNFGTTDGTKIQLWACTGGPNQQWDTRGFRVHYDNPNAFNKVLDDTGFGGNGTRQELFTNNGGVNQQWATF